MPILTPGLQLPNALVFVLVCMPWKHAGVSLSMHAKAGSRKSGHGKSGDLAALWAKAMLKPVKPKSARPGLRSFDALNVTEAHAGPVIYSFSWAFTRIFDAIDIFSIAFRRGDGDRCRSTLPFFLRTVLVLFSVLALLGWCGVRLLSFFP